MLNLLIIDSNTGFADEVKGIIGATGQHFVSRCIDSSNVQDVLTQIEMGKPDAIIFCANCEGPRMYQDCELMQTIRKYGYIFHIVMVVPKHNYEVSRIALDCGVEWIIDYDTEKKLITKLLERMDQKHKLIVRTRFESIQKLFSDMIIGNEEVNTNDWLAFMHDYSNMRYYQVFILRILQPYNEAAEEKNKSEAMLNDYEQLQFQLKALNKFIISFTGVDILILVMGVKEDIESGRNIIKKHLKNMSLQSREKGEERIAWAAAGSIVEHMGDIQSSYKIAKTLIGDRLFFEPYSIIEQDTDVEDQQIQEERYRIFDVQKALLAAIDMNDSASIHRVLSRLKNNLVNISSYKCSDMYGIYKTLISTMFQKLEKSEISQNNLSFNYELAKREYMYFCTMDDVFSYLENRYKDCARIIKEKEESDAETPIIVAKQYIKSYYNSPLTLKELSDYVGMEAKYFSEYFRKATGVTFKEYQTDIRIKMSKKMLLNPDATLEEIAEAIGYNDSKYFSRVFKKVNGIPPGEYRKKHHIG